MDRITRRGLGVAAIGFGLVVAASSAVAQQSPPVRVRGQIEKVDGDMLTIKARDGKQVNVKLADNARVMAMVKASIEDIKPNSYIGVTAMPQMDGSQKAVAIHIFLEAQRGTGEGHRPWDLQPGSTMTNAAVDTKVTGVDGETITVKYKDGEKKVIVPPATPIVAYTPSDKSELKEGAQIIIFNAQTQPDGGLVAPAINVGRGLTPPM
jgi:outer membrane lipoprotein SlyB